MIDKKAERKAPSPRRSGKCATTTAINTKPTSGCPSPALANPTNQPAKLSQGAVTEEHLRDNVHVSCGLDQAAPVSGIAIGGNEDGGIGDDSKTERRKWVEFVKTDTLKPHPLSERIYGAAEHPSLRASVDDVGIQTPLMVSKGSGYVLSGNSRLAVAKALELEEVPVIYRADDLTPEEEEDLVITGNAGREKNREMRAREYRELKRIEIALGKLRKPAAERNGTGPNLDPTVKKSRHKAAERIGESASTLDKGLKVVEAADMLKAKGKTDEAKALLSVLNAESYDAAFIFAQKERVIPATQKRVVAAPAAVPEGIQVPAANPKPVKPEDIAAEPKAKAEDAEESSPVVPSIDAREVRAPDRKSDPIEDVALAVEKAGEHLDAVVTFLRSEVVSQMTKEQKAGIGKYIGMVNRSAANAGIKEIES